MRNIIIASNYNYTKIVIKKLGASKMGPARRLFMAFFVRLRGGGSVHSPTDPFGHTIVFEIFLLIRH